MTYIIIIIIHGYLIQQSPTLFIPTIISHKYNCIHNGSYNYMSFFPLQKRDIDKPQNSLTKSLGPGSYQTTATDMKRQNYAPFGSLTRKKSKFATEGLGPGQYDISRQLIKPSISKYENRNIIIVKINDEGGHQFKSRTNRFESKIQTTDVGPGTYESTPLQKKSRSTSLSKKPNIAEKMRNINHQYIISRRQPTLTTDPPIIEAENENQSETPCKGIVNWSLNRKERFDLSVKQENMVEERQKALSQINLSRKKRIRPSAVFASKSIKSHLETQIYKTNNAFKVELRKMINFKDDAPGPGSYDVNLKNELLVPNKFQFFGSTVDRFNDRNECEAIGPGSYKIQGSSDKKSNKEFILQVQKEQRHSYIPKSDHPGPGSYVVEVRKNTNSQSEKQFEHPFGSNHPRSIFENKEKVQPMSDQLFQTNAKLRQRQQRKDEVMLLRRSIKQNHPSSIFASSSKRFQDKLACNIDIGSYEITQEDINQRLEKYQSMAKQLQECQLHKPPFQSSQQRFKEEKAQQNAHHDCWCLVKSVQKQMIEHESPAFVSNDKRTVVFSGGNHVPPVGYYSSGHRGMIKDSFNSRFRKKNQNHQKKNQISLNNHRRLKTDPPAKPELRI